MKYILAWLLLVTTICVTNIPRCDSAYPLTLNFTYIYGQADNTTSASLCHDESFLYVSWVNIDKEIISTYKQCNDPLEKEDVVGIFIALTDESYPTHYFQLDISPSGQMLFADVTNIKRDCSALGYSYFDCGGVKHKAQKTAKGWNADLQVSLETIGRGRVRS
jgi:hypothetical protein